MWFEALKSHLFWFICLGVLIFVIDGFVNNQEEEIVVDAAVVARIAAMWEGQMQRAPTAQEMESLVADWIEEEILYREGRRLRLDEDDLIVRRRLVQKVNFMAEESAASDPSRDELVRYFEANPERFSLPVRYTFSHVFFQTESAARDMLPRLEDAGEQAWSLGHATLTNPVYTLRSAREIQSDFGPGFVEALSTLTPGNAWQGPIASEFGSHYVKLVEKRAEQQPLFEDVQELVLNDYLFEKRKAARNDYIQALQERYRVVLGPIE